MLFAWLNDHKSLGSITNNANTNTNTNTHHKSVVGVGVGGVGVGGVPTQQRVGVPPRVAWEAKRALVCDFMQHLNASKVCVCWNGCVLCSGYVVVVTSVIHVLRYTPSCVTHHQCPTTS